MQWGIKIKIRVVEGWSEKGSKGGKVREGSGERGTRREGDRVREGQGETGIG